MNSTWQRWAARVRGGLTSPRLCFALAAAAILLPAAVAWARPGGGHGYSGGGGGGGGGSGGGDSDAIFWLLWLCFRHPSIGVPLLAVVGAVWWWSQRKRPEQDWSSALAAPAAQLSAPGLSPRRALDRLRAFDPDFSLIVFEDFIYALYQKAHEARGGGDLDTMAPYLAPPVRAALATRSQVAGVEGVVVGSMALQWVTGVDSPSADKVTVQLSFDANYTERDAKGAAQAFFVSELWTLERAKTAKSRPPAKARTFDCPNCGAPLDGAGGNRCEYCQSVVDTGAFDWLVTGATLLRSERRPPALSGQVNEVGTSRPTLRDPEAALMVASLSQRDPAFDMDQLKGRVRVIHRELNQGWSARDAGKIRPFLSDGLFEAQLYWLDAYREQGLRNVLEQVQVSDIELVAAWRDKWFDAITFRVFASSLDFTVRESDGKVVSGSKRRVRAYSEYWTLIRSAQKRGPTELDMKCSNCGAPLQVNQGGQCQYCEARVTTGEFDWVLSRIEQDEAYRG